MSLFQDPEFPLAGYSMSPSPSRSFASIFSAHGQKPAWFRSTQGRSPGSRAQIDAAMMSDG